MTKPKTYPKLRTSFRKSKFAAACALAVLFAAAGCSGMKVKVGMKVPLNQTTVSAIQVSLPKGPAMAPGEHSPLLVQLTQPDGKVLVTEGVSQGKVMWKDLRVDADIVTASDNGMLILNADPRVSEDQIPHVTVTVPSHPGLRADLDIPLRYDFKYTANFSGSNVIDGTSSSDGHPVQLRVRLRQADHRLLQVSLRSGGTEDYYLIDPKGGSLMVRSDAGSGVWGGQGARGGTITVTYDPQAKPYLHVLHFSNRGGPRPIFYEEPLPPLW